LTVSQVWRLVGAQLSSNAGWKGARQALAYVMGQSLARVCNRPASEPRGWSLQADRNPQAQPCASPLSCLRPPQLAHLAWALAKLHVLSPGVWQGLVACISGSTHFSRARLWRPEHITQVSSEGLQHMGPQRHQDLVTHLWAGHGACLLVTRPWILGSQAHLLEVIPTFILGSQAHPNAHPRITGSSFVGRPNVYRRPQEHVLQANGVGAACAASARAAGSKWCAPVQIQARHVWQGWQGLGGLVLACHCSPSY